MHEVNSQMRTIKSLPEAARNSMRSGIILFDLTRVVEELVFNSLDAGATKVSVFVGVVTCYLKVVDNGSGISRDGLVLLGERYATSKLYHLADMDAKSGSFGFRGEALASISDISLLEVVTKAYGRPNGYRKVMKGSNCLYLGIDDDRKDAGTTVVVRDLFYNQPVRRKYMQSSPKKILHCVKKCVLRIGLVHSKVSFNVVDIESDDVLLRMHPSSSPLSLLMKSFGIEDSSSLHEVNASDDVLELSGYISGRGDSLAIKAFQYVYINSRFVSRGPIHKLLNQLATSYECFDPLKANNGCQKGKRNRPQADPTYILNLSCPRSLYDLTFEPSKTCAEFKDWEPILTFIKKAIQHLWREDKTRETFVPAPDILGKDDMQEEGDNIIPVEKDFTEISEFARKKCRIQSHQTSSHLLYAPLDEINNDGGYLFHREHKSIPFPEFHKNTTGFKEQQTEVEYLHQTNYSFQPWDTVTGEDEKCMWTTYDSDFLGNSFTAAGRYNILRSQSTNESLKVEHSLRNGSAGGTSYFDFHEFNNESEVSEDIRKPFLHHCTSRGKLPLDGAIVACEDGFESPIDVLKTKQKWVRSDEKSNNPQVGVRNMSFDCFSRTLWQDEASSAQQHATLSAKGDMAADSNFFSRDSAKSFPSSGDPSAEKKFYSAAQLVNSGSGLRSSSFEWSSVTLDPLFQSSCWDVEHFTSNNALGGNSIWHKDVIYGNFADDEDKDCRFSYDIMSKSSSQENCIPSCTENCFDFKDYADSCKDFRKFLQGQNLRDIFSSGHSAVLIDETDRLCHWSGKGYIGIDKYENQSGKFRYQGCEQNPFPKERSIRSHSAPPFYRQKRKFISLNHCSITKVGKSDAHSFSDAFTSKVAVDSKHLQQSSGVHRVHFKPTFIKDVTCRSRPDMKNNLHTTSSMKKIDECRRYLCSAPQKGSAVEDFISEAIQDSVNSGTKWRNSSPQLATTNESCDIHNQDSVLDISSGILQHLAGVSLVPESIDKNCLEDAKVLQQVDKKFIPVVAGGTLAVIDQHAADERIRLEELRQKVIFGEGKRITYLDAEQELILPEIGHQLLQNYAEQIKDWGWICNIDLQASKSFKRNLSVLHRQPTVVTLLAVPCILGVNLSDVDLLEFLQQLADTDGSSTMPPSVLRVLNFKACRGAIMFGDSLLPTECSLIVEELKQTSLCFQCAHGRPTTVPLVNLEVLHKQIAKLGSTELWHGLHRRELNINRSTMRLSAARDFCC